MAGRRLADRFELGARVGKGSLSVVHEAIDHATGRQVAIKLAASLEEGDQVRQRFDREAAALAVISSAAFEAGRERGRRMPLDQTVELARDVV